MNTLVEAIKESQNYGVTQNGALTLKSTLDKNLDFFAVVGSARNNLPGAISLFSSAFIEDPVTAIRIALWARDARGGAGEREVFRKILAELVKTSPRAVASIMLSGKIEEIGRFDDYVDLLVNEKIVKPVREDVATRLRDCIVEKMPQAGLVAKWLPRKGKEAAIIRSLMKIGPKEYRKMLVNATNVVESKMCSKEWKDIEFSHIPSVAMSRYAKAFGKNAPTEFSEYKAKLESGEVKAKASVLFPYDVIRSVDHGSVVVADSQWKELPDYINGVSKILPIIDVSGSMTVPAGKSSISCMDVAVSLGLYLTGRQEGAFKNLTMTFETDPSWIVADKEKFSENVEIVRKASWGGSTNLQASFDLLLSTAIDKNVPFSDMPEYLIVISDMEFNVAQGNYAYPTKSKKPVTNFKAIEEKFFLAGYKRPKLIFWNVNARPENLQVKKDEDGTAMITGFSPSIMQSVLKLEEITPLKIMMEAISSPRYDIEGLTVDNAANLPSNHK